MQRSLLTALLILFITACTESTYKIIRCKPCTHLDTFCSAQKKSLEVNTYVPNLLVNNRQLKFKIQSISEKTKEDFCNISFDKITNPGLPVHDSINRFVERIVLDGLNSMSPEEYGLDLKKRAKHFLDEGKGLDGSYEFDFEVKISQRVKGIITVKSSFWINAGGAHGGGGTTITNFFTSDGKTVFVQDLFKKNALLDQLGLIYFKKAIGLKPEDDLKDDNWDVDDKNFQLSNNFEPFEDRIVWIINTEEIGPYMNGGAEINIPMKDLEPLLKVKLQKFSL